MSGSTCRHGGPVPTHPDALLEVHGDGDPDTLGEFAAGVALRVVEAQRSAVWFPSGA
jgi:hypothetical protein